SCWDELGCQATPRVELATTLPLVAAFLEANWWPNALSVWGLSSLGKALPKDVPDAEYLERGPEHFGYVIDERGERSADLCAPVAWLAR
ncbi:MAG: hypothetical protein ACRENE_17050, partial [Polyangiaceae bacterium]